MGATIQLIPNPNVQWQDSLGAAQLTVASPRFDNWNPMPTIVGPKRVSLATGLTYTYVERTDYTATFQMAAIPPSAMALMHRLKVWLEGGGQITVNTQDSIGSSYTCALAPGSSVTWSWDKGNMWFTISLAVKNTLQQAMLCLYSTQLGAGYTLTVTPTSFFLQAGQSSVPITAVIVDAAGNPVTIPVVWSSSAPSIAGVTSTGNLTAAITAGLGGGNCIITATAGGLTASVPCAVAVNNTVSAISVTPSPLAFTQTTYTGTPQLGVSGVPASLLTAVMRNNAGATVAYTTGSLVWTCTNGTFTLTDNLNGTCSVQPTEGGQTGTVFATNPATGAQAAVAVSSVASVMVAVIPSTSNIVLTAPGQQGTITFVTVDQYGQAVP